MTKEQAFTLKLGDEVLWRADDPSNAEDGSKGKVIEISGDGFLVLFQDGDEVYYPYVDARKLRRVPVAA